MRSVPRRLGHAVESAIHVFKHENVTEFGEGVRWIAQHVDDRFSIFDVERDSSVTNSSAMRSSAAVSI